MSTNNDNAMTRFLFAILQQKSLKDIDWNKVAHDPILTQEITNGHAARMRYSRFKSSLLGIEPQRRNRRNTKNKVTKSKKEAKPKNENPKEKNGTIKPDPNTAATPQQELPQDFPPRIKNESTVKNEIIQSPFETQYTPADFSTPAMPETQSQLHNRLLTPCSDTDIFGPSQTFATSPANEMLHTQPTFDYAGEAALCAHEHSQWQPSPSYSPYQIQYELDNTYPGGASSLFCDHQHTSRPEGFGIAPSAMMSPGPVHTHVPVKHEEWDTHFH